jgi:hypothetical protein
VAEIPCLEVITTKPDNQTWLELARIDLQPGVTEIVDPEDPEDPKGNEINRLYVARAGAVGVIQDQMSREIVQQLILVMRRTRRDFAALNVRFPVASASDARHAALTVETLARSGCLRPGRLPHLLAALTAIERDAGQELEEQFGSFLDTAPEFLAYRTAVRELEAALKQGEELGILTAQDAVAEAARELSEVVVEAPIAVAGPDQTVETYEELATLMLDASESHARGGREIMRYLWLRKA